jgi:23S rRNA pseudouridine1911/1915/1917 synthase
MTDPQPAPFDDLDHEGVETLRYEFVVKEKNAGRRLDAYVATRFPDYSRSFIQSLMREGAVTLNGGRVKPSHKPVAGDVVLALVPTQRHTAVPPQDIPLDIVYEDEFLLVVDKPSGLTVHPGSGQPDGTLANALVHLFDSLPEVIGADRPGIVHRLDKDTSGAIVVAKNERVQRDLSAAFAARTVKKTYLACVHGAPTANEGVVNLPIGRHPGDRKKMTIAGAEGRASTTRWAVDQRLPRHTLIRCSPVTGRTHQIRVHLKSLRLPIVGDPIYGNHGLPGEDLAPRLLLHAWRIAFTHPVTGEAESFEAPLPPDYAKALERLARLAPPRR